jgi:hypothetical protein
MALHPNFPISPYNLLDPEVRWFPAAEEMRSTAYEKLLPPLVAKVREAVKSWRDSGYAGASETSRALLRWWFETDHLIHHADGTQSVFRYPCHASWYACFEGKGGFATPEVECEGIPTTREQIRGCGQGSLQTACIGN